MAFRRGFRKYYKRRGVRRGARRTYRRKTVSKSVKRYVKRAIHRNQENKEIIDYAANIYINSMSGGGSFSSTSNGRYLILSPNQGTGDNQRVGNQIRVVHGVVKGHINLLPYDSTYNSLQTPIIVKLWLVRSLDYAATQAVSNPNLMDNFFRGNGTPLPPQGNPLDVHLPINDVQWRVLATKTFELGATSATATGSVGSGGYFDNSKMTLPFYFNWGKHVKKVLKYSDASSLCLNDNVYLFMQAVRADGFPSGTQRLCEYHLVNHMKYEDA